MIRISGLPPTPSVLDMQPVEQLRSWNPSRSDWFALNPQPLSPKQQVVGNWVNPGNSVSLNPQPLPPKDVFANVKAALKDAFRFHSENPETDRGIIIVGGKSGANNPEANRGIIIIGGRIQIR
jgi:hypothetical protein